MPDDKKQPETPAQKQGVFNPHTSEDPAIADDAYAKLDPTKVVGTYAEQPDPNADRPAPQPNVPPGVKKAPADDEQGAPAIGEGA